MSIKVPIHLFSLTFIPVLLACGDGEYAAQKSNGNVIVTIREEAKPDSVLTDACMDLSQGNSDVLKLNIPSVANDIVIDWEYDKGKFKLAVADKQGERSTYSVLDSQIRDEGFEMIFSARDNEYIIRMDSSNCK
ncbi:hypothetical protein [Oligoflexus tunisiensis]|uniref:hypothetical protein n=1 Tax=Oligoflexus tunisiensis TaxID=708132 RepID=UPI00114C9141|nr:hypothetical protein [Oligoflexus tunisiensis]